MSRHLRKVLENSIKRACRIARNGAQKAVAELGVGDSEAPKHLSSQQRALRNRLRAHGLQLGDRRDPKSEVQATSKLIEECAYKQWHRMLFARFLAERNLLIEPNSGVATTLDEVEELAREQMLPQIFRKNDPVLEIILPPETRSGLENILKSLCSEIFIAGDSLGWVYQYWQADKKDHINASEEKIGAEQLPAVTQLFTEDYMVLHLLHNTLGAWWAGRVFQRNPDLAQHATNEDELRAACRVGNIDWSYLRFVRDEDDQRSERPWRPASGTFSDWPRTAREITLFDPCMGSGHFLVSALPILLELRRAEEGLTQDEAVDAVLRDNLFGLELDARCTQIAALNIALTAWSITGFRLLPKMNVACSGFALDVSRDEWLRLAEKTPDVEDTLTVQKLMKTGLEALYELFTKAPSLGSLINPRREAGDAFRADFTKLESRLNFIFDSLDSKDTENTAVTAQGMAQAAKLLNRQFTLVVTNVPYLGRKRQGELLRSYCAQNHAAAKSDLATCFVERAVEFCKPGGSTALVFIQNAFSLVSYEQFRKALLTNTTVNFIVKLGAKSFRTIMYDFGVTLSIFSKQTPTLDSRFSGVDLDAFLNLEAKANAMVKISIETLSQQLQLSNPNCAIAFGERSDLPLLEQYADSYQGSGLADIVAYRKFFWEIQDFGKTWTLHQSSPNGEHPYTGMQFIARWEEGAGTLVNLRESTIRGRKAWGKMGVACAWLGRLPVGLYLGTLFDNSAAVIIPKKPEHLNAIWCFLRSADFHSEVRKINQKTQVANATLVKVPFDLDKWQSMAEMIYPSDLPAPYSNDPTQWLFDGNPNSAAHILQVAVARLLGYRWPAQAGIPIPKRSSIASDHLARHADVDGIVCMTALHGNRPCNERLNELLADSFGADWSAARLAGLLAEAGYAGKTLDHWLLDGFFAQHCEIFRQRPFIWHIWDGHRDGFHALVNYHRLTGANGEGKRTLEKLIYAYLGDWIDRLCSEQKAGVEGSDSRRVCG